MMINRAGISGMYLRMTTSKNDFLKRAIDSVLIAATAFCVVGDTHYRERKSII